jgi:hypothetical protein
VLLLANVPGIARAAAIAARSPLLLELKLNVNIKHGEGAETKWPGQACARSGLAEHLRR